MSVFDLFMANDIQLYLQGFQSNSDVVFLFRLTVVFKLCHSVSCFVNTYTLKHECPLCNICQNVSFLFPTADIIEII